MMMERTLEMYLALIERISLISLWVVLGSIQPCQALAEDCPELRKSDAAGLTSYLQATKSSLSRDCVAYSLRRLGDERYTEAAEVITKYLDFKVSPRRLIRGILRIPWHDEYPAMEALVEIGKPAELALAKAITDGFETTVGADNAIETLLAIDREDPTEVVRRLMKASMSADNAVIAARLSEAARLAATKCPTSIKRSCEIALGEVKP